MKRPSILTVPFLGALAIGCVVTPAVYCANEMFTVHEFATGTARHQTALAGSFGGGTALVVVDMEETGQQHVQIYGFDGDDWSRALDAAFGPGILFVDVLHGADLDRLIAYRHGRVVWFDPDSATSAVLAEMSMTYRAPNHGGIPRIDISHDLNRDGLDDLVVPVVDGFRVALQLPDGSFATPVELGPPEPFLDASAYGEKRTYRQVGITPENISWYLARVHQLDYDRDGLSDLAFWNGNRFDLYRQDETGTFQTTPDTFRTDVSFDFDGPYALAFQIGDANPVSMVLGLGRHTDHRVLKGFRDLDADGVADLITLTLSGRSPLRLRGRFEIHFGRPVPNGTAFSAEPDTTVDAPGRSAGGEPWGYATHRFDDFDGDGDLDAMLGAVNTGGPGMLRAMAANAVSIDLALFRLGSRTYPDKPDAKRRVSSAFRPLSRRGPLFPAVLLGDVNGDGLKDLVIGDRWDRLSVFLASDGPDPFQAPAVRIPVAIPAAGDLHVRLADVNRDGREDVVIHHPSSTEPNRVIVLMARS
ncbi:MAG: VCBS repeat-containing protein [Gammaproteobacteria bacterium]|nr:VCBS repeat-containing protein [Gammaproteobacteria bacterium]